MYDPGTTTFMIMSCALVLMMGPALALFYGGLSRRKNVVNTMLMCVMAMGAVGCLWAVLGDSIAYGGPDAFDEDGAAWSMSLRCLRAVSTGYSPHGLLPK